MRIGFIGFGEAAFRISVGLGHEGLKGIQAYDKFSNQPPYSELIRKRAAEAAVSLASSIEELVRAADIVISAVSANAAIELAELAQPHLRPSQIYVDVNAASPMTKQRVDAIISPVALFADGAVMAPVPGLDHKVPISLAGPGARAFYEAMAPFGMNLAVLEGAAGCASASKTLRSIFMKGFVAVLLETIVAAHRYGVEDDVLASVETTLTSGPLSEVINGLLTRTVIHSERREHEMAEVIATLEALPVDATMSKATKEKLRWCTNLGLKQYFKGTPPEDFHQILVALDRQDGIGPGTTKSACSL